MRLTNSSVWLKLRAMLAERISVVEFERQLSTLIEKGYPWSAGLTDEQFRQLAEPLAARAAELETGEEDAPVEGGLGGGASPGDGTARDDGAGQPARIPFLLVAGRDLVSPLRAAERIERRGRRAIVTMLSGEDLDAFAPIEQVTLPDAALYLLSDVDLGWATRNDPPERALPLLLEQGRSPLTLEEGIALATQFPEAVATNAGWSLLGSRRGDRRVTAMWISRGSPKLGWCFAGAPHTWLGSASCGGRLAA